MKAVILVGGKGTRLLPITSKMPKALVPVLNTPFLEHVIHHLRSHGIVDIILSIGNLAAPIQDYFGDGSRFGVRMNYAIEKSPLGTAGGIKNAEKFIDATFVALNGDVFTDLDITALVDFHRRRKAVATIALTTVEDNSAYGVIETDKTGKVFSFREKPKKGEVECRDINAGTYVLEPEVLAEIEPAVETSIERDIFPRLLPRGIYALASSAYWLDIGTPEKYLQVNRDMLTGKCCEYDPDAHRKSMIGEGCYIHTSARIVGPVVIGNNCTIGPDVKIIGPVTIGKDCRILDGATVSDSVIWPDTWIGPRAIVKNSIIADHCRLDADSVVEQSMLGCNVNVCVGHRLAPGSKIHPGTKTTAT
jgi:mannose-1-phosphate guanylyltransferase